MKSTDDTQVTSKADPQDSTPLKFRKDGLYREQVECFLITLSASARHS